MSPTLYDITIIYSQKKIGWVGGGGGGGGEGIKRDRGPISLMLQLKYNLTMLSIAISDSLMIITQVMQCYYNIAKFYNLDLHFKSVITTLPF